MNLVTPFVKLTGDVAHESINISLKFIDSRRNIMYKAKDAEKSTVVRRCLGIDVCTSVSGYIPRDDLQMTSKSVSGYIEMTFK